MEQASQVAPSGPRIHPFDEFMAQTPRKLIHSSLIDGFYAHRDRVDGKRGVLDSPVVVVRGCSAGAGVGAVHDNVDRSRAVWLCVGSA